MSDMPKVSANVARRTRKKGIGQKIKKYAVLTIIVFIGVLFMRGEYGLLKIYRLRAKIKTAQDDIIRLKVKGADLKWELDKLKSDTQYIQLYASEHFGYAKPAGTVIQFVPPPQDSLR